MKGGSSGQADVDLSFYVSPLGGRAEPAHEFLERRGILRGVLEPGEEVEGLAEVTAVVQAAGDRLDEAGRDVVRPLLEDLSALVLGQRPPRR